MTDLHRSGCDELLCVRTDSVSVTIKGTAGNAVPAVGKISSVTVTGAAEYDIAVLGRTAAECVIGAAKTYKTVPLFFETGSYELIIESFDGAAPGFWHEDEEITNAVTPVGRSGHILSGVISFKNNVGFSELHILLGGEEHLSVTVEALPSRMDYKNDYKELLADITREVYGLIFEVLGKTYSRYASREAGGTAAEFWAVMRGLYSELISAADAVIRCPRHELRRTYETADADKVVRIDAGTVRWLEKHPEHARRVNGRVEAARALAERREVTYDTRENRFVKYIMQSAAKRLRAFAGDCILMGGDAERISEEAAAMAEGLERRCRAGVLAGVGKYTGGAGLPQIFVTAPGYRELYRAYLMISRGLSAEAGSFEIPLKNVALLYEYWCFIKLGGMLRGRYRLVSQNAVKVKRNGAALALEEGESSQLGFVDPKSGDRIFLTYKPRQRNAPTVVQHPDMVLSLIKRGAETRCEYAFEASYREETGGPAETDINAMHRYRDAIVCSNDGSAYARSMYGAYVLFPCANEKAYREHRFYESIEKVNIGGLPFLPSATELVGELIEELIGASDDTAFERAVLPAGTEKRLAKVNWNERDVLIGVMSRAKQLDVCLEHRFYHIPARQLTDGDFPIRYVALYQSKNLFGKDAGIRWYGEVMRCAMVRRRAIKELPKESDEPYFKFIIKEWKRLDRTIAPKEAGFVREFTNLFLLESCSELPELMLRSESEYRLYMEMKRLWTGVGISGEDNGAPIRLSAGDVSIFADGGDILVCRGGRVIEKIPADLFSRLPGVMFGRIKRVLGLF